MGGPGAGHKSERARRARLVNIQKARAARKRAPLPWRSGVESRIIEQLVWQWWMDKNSGQWLVVSGEKSKQQVIALRATGRVNPAPTKAKRPWAKYRVARFLGVSHTWVNKLVRRIETDPERMRRKMRAFAPATFEKLERAREETRRERERGWLRGPIRWRRVKVTLEGRKKTVVARLRHGFGAASGQAPAAPVRYSELPQWARGLLLPGDPGKTTPGSGTRTPSGQTPATSGKPRPVPFAFRRRR